MISLDEQNFSIRTAVCKELRKDNGQIVGRRGGVPSFV